MSRQARRTTRPSIAPFLPARPTLPNLPTVTPAVAGMLLVVTAGIAVRVGLWWQDRSFWRDELALVQSLQSYSLTELLGPLSDAQSAPPMWLWAERAVTTVLGDGERAYRLLPLLAGCAALVALALVSWRLTRRPPIALVPVALATTIPEAVFYSAQTKQYTTDLLLVTLLLLLGHGLLTAERASNRALVTWYVVLTVAPWFSHGFMLCAPAAGAWVALLCWRRGRLSLRSAVAGLGVPAASVLGSALLAQSLTGRVSAFTDYWAEYLAPDGAWPAEWLRWHGFVVSELLNRELGGQLWPLAAALLLAGVVVVVRRDPAVAVLVLIPVLSPYLAAVADVYPFGRRLAMFCLPSLVLLAGLAVDGLFGLGCVVGRRAEQRWHQGRYVRSDGVGDHAVDGVSAPGVTGVTTRGRVGGFVGATVAVALVGFSIWSPPSRLAHALTYEYGVDDYRTALQYVAGHREPGDLLIVGNGDRAGARVYGSQLDIPARQMLRAFPGSDARPRRHCPLPDRVADAQRIWLVSGDLVTIYGGVTSRYAITAPLTDDFRPVYQHVQGQVTVQLLLAGNEAEPERARCLGYAPLGQAGDPGFPTPLPTR